MRTATTIGGQTLSNRSPQALLLVALVALAFSASWRSAPASPSRPADPLAPGEWSVSTDFRPSADGLPFRNPARDPRDPLVRQVTTEQCGGMAFIALDGYASGQGPTVRSAREWSVQLRSFESVMGNGARFALWSMWPDRARGPWEGGVAAMTRDEELPLLARRLEQGPVPLGLVRARTLPAVGRNHQVVAYEMRRRGDDVQIGIYDPTQPLADDITLELDLSNERGPIVELAGDWEIARWRGLFVERYTAVARRP